MGIKPLPSRQHFQKRVIKSILVASIVLFLSLGAGVVGYRMFFNLSWTDSLLNASMILTGMGPVDKAVTDGAKIFSSIYALYSGVAFLTSVAVIFSPIVTRMLHRFHVDLED